MNEGFQCTNTERSQETINLSKKSEFDLVMYQCLFLSCD
jgi:hypothetical protein